MVVTNYSKQQLAYALGSSIPSNFIQCFAVGSGSGTALATNTILQAETLRVMQTGSVDFTTAYKATFQGDFNSVQMSGLIMTEFGLFASGAANVGSIWQRETIGSIVFDGTNELEISSTLHIY